MPQHVRTADTPPFVTLGAEYAADIAETRRTEQSVTQGVRGDVAVGMSRTTVGVVEGQAQQPAPPPRLDGMYVGAKTDPRHHV
jgi:hypothetical protein